MMVHPALRLIPLLIALLLAACQGDPRAERIAKMEASINIGADPRTLDPSLATDVPSARAILCMTRGLTVLDGAGKPQPELAESWSVSADGLTWDFKLRAAKWSNGDPVTADDFLYTWTRRLLNPEFASEYAQMLYCIKGAKAFYNSPQLGPESVWVWAIAPDMLRVTLENPTPYFLQLVAHHSFFPVSRKVDEENPDWARKPKPGSYVGNGPYKLVDYRSGDALTMEPNPEYWNAGGVKMKRLTLRMIEQESTGRIAFDTGEIDVANSVPRADIKELKGTPELKFYPMLGTYYFEFNCTQPPLNDARVRRALGLAVDRKAIVETITGGGEQPAFYMTPVSLYSTPPAPDFKDADYEEARRLLAEAGYPGGKGLRRLNYLYNTLEQHKQIAQVLQETWRRELGVELNIENQEFKVVLENKSLGQFDIARASWIADFGDPVTFLDIYESNSLNNYSRFKDPAYDALLEKARSEPDTAAREQILLEAEHYLMREMPAVPIYTYTNPQLTTPRLLGYDLNPMGMFDAAKLDWAPASDGKTGG